MTVDWPESTIITRPRKRAPRKRTAKRAAPERAIQVAVVKALRQHGRGCVWYSVPNGGYRHMHTAMKLKAEGTRSGTPDLCFVLSDGRAAFLELKAEKGRQSPEQKIFEQEVTSLNALYSVAYSVDEAWGVLAAWGCLPSEVEQ